MAEKTFVSKERLTYYDTKLKALINDIVTSSEYDDTELTKKVNANTSAIETLNGDATEPGSVAKQVADAVASIVADAPEAYDTLVEISDWISSHSNDAAEMNSSILANTNAINELKAVVGTLPDDTAATTIIEYIDSKVAAIKDYTSDIATAKSEAILEAKTYADGLATNYATAAQGAKADTALQPEDLVEITEADIDSLFASTTE